MPPKVNVHLSEQRAWGTRYDSLNASPSPRSSSLSPSVADSGSPDFSGPTGRSWADDEVVVNTGVLEAADTHSNTSSSRTGESARMPHEASVFIGSLPTDIKETELVHLLTEHLSRYGDIQNVKIIHDAKGGVCAFVQCENAFQAARIISQNRSSPQAFMGRFLRCEAARAFRSLLISYRKPTEFVLHDNNEGSPPCTEVRENRLPGRVVELELPSAMRIWRSPASRYPAVLYESEARNLDDTHTDGGLFIEHLQFNVEEIRKIASAFGPLESLIELDRFSNQIENCEEGNVCRLRTISDIGTLPPHNAPRSDVMDKGIWEVKWCHRNDCLSALMTLRRVPHLNVTWAHQRVVSPSFAGKRNDLVRSETASQLHRNFSSLFGSSNAAYNSPKAALVYNKDHGRESHTSFASARNSVPHLYNKMPEPSALKFDDGKHTRAVSNAAIRKNSVLPTRDEKSKVKSSEEKAPNLNLKWSANDFPPLLPQQDNEHGKSDAIYPDQAHPSKCDSPTPPRGRRSTVTDSLHTNSTVSIDPENVNRTVSKPILVHRRSLSHPTPRAQYAESTPQTPELAMSPLTPKTSSVSSGFPQTPYTSTIPLPDCCDGDKVLKGARGDYIGDENVDRQTIFVGGLETFGPNAWDENKLINLFRQYGPIESVKIIRPISKKSAFAFIRFEDEVSPVRAIQREHNQVYNGRTIRVQLRDNQTFRGGWKSRGGTQMRMQHTASDMIQEMSLNRGSGSVGKGSTEFSHAQIEHLERPDSRAKLNSSSIASSENWNASAVNATSVDTKSVNLNSNLPMASPLPKVNVHQGSPSLSVGSSPHLTSSLELLSAPTGGMFAAPALAPVTYYNGQGYIVPYGPGSIAHTIPAQVPPYSAVLAPQNSSLPTNQLRGVVGSNPDHWVDMHRSPFPWTSYSYIPTATQDMANTNTDRKKPPLSPTGFIQGEMGSLIPVYPPDALNHYMNSNSPGQLSTQLQEQTATSLIQSHHMLYPNTHWQNFQHPSQFYTYPISSSFSPIIQHPFIQPQLNGQPLATGQTSWVAPVQMATFANTSQQQHQSLATTAISSTPHVQTQNQYAYPPVMSYPPVKSTTLPEQRLRQRFDGQSLRRNSIHLTHNRNNNFGRSARSSPGGPSNISTMGSDTQGILRSNTVSSSGRPKENKYSPHHSSLFK